MRFNFYFLLSLIVFSFSCNKNENIAFSSVHEDVLFFDSILNIRALEVNSNKVVAANYDGKIITIMDNFIDIKQYESKADSVLFPNFRSLSVVNDSIYSLSIGNPALIFKNGRVVYKEYGSSVFYDSMSFWNETEGIAMGDPVGDCLSIVITRDGGNNWTKLPCSDLPKVKKGEAAFAASNTNISIQGNKCWIATGGIHSNVYFSNDKGHSWKSYKTPIIQGQETTGIYSIDFYNDTLGYAIGGDYTKPLDNFKNKIKTIDGGKSWKVIGESNGPGYRSCVQFIPGSQGKQLVAVGFEGVDISNDYGLSWSHLSDSSYYTIRFVNYNTAYAAGKHKISKLIFK